MEHQQMIIGLIIGIIFLIYMILKTKIHTFLALIVATVTVGVIGGMEYSAIISSITKGFGGTLGSIGIIIGFGVMMGELFEVSGAAKKMALVFLRVLGKGKEDIAMAITGFIVSIPIFCDSGFVILTPLAKSISKTTKKSIVSLGIALASGLVITHSLVPPTPGPVGVAGIFGVSVGSLLLWGIVISIPMVTATLTYAKYMGKKIYQIPSDDGETWIRPEKIENIDVNYSEEEDKNLPSTFMAFLPIIAPIILILLGTVTSALKITGGLSKVLQFLGMPIIAVGIGLLITIFGLARKLTQKQVITEMEKGIKSAGIIILITGAGGAFGMLLRDSGVGNTIAQSIVKTSLPPILLPFIVATIIRFIQGSGTVAMLTAASITAPIILVLNVNPVFAALSACIGSLFFSHYNDSFFWVVNRSIGITDAKEQLKVYSITSTIAWGTGIVTLLILNMIFA